MIECESYACTGAISIPMNDRTSTFPNELSPLVVIYKLILLGRLRFLLCGRRLLLWLARVELGDDLGRDTVKLLLREDAQEGPSEVERVEDCP